MGRRANDGVPPAVASAQNAVNKVLEDSGKCFHEGLEALKQNRRSDSGQKFDKAVEVFLYSSINIQKDQRLQGCYSQLIETVYRMEFPSDAQLPQIRSLQATCGWRWNDADLKLADDVAALVRPSAAKSADPAILAAAATRPGDSAVAEPSVGFNEQEFEASPLDELAKLELTTTEQSARRSCRSTAVSIHSVRRC